MSWIAQLERTYDAAMGNSLLAEDDLRPLPPGHILFSTQIEITLDGTGNFIRAEVVPKEQSLTCVPATEDSASRAGINPPPHPLADKLQYVAADFRAFGGVVTKGFLERHDQPHHDYRLGLEAWAEAFSHPKLTSILAYIRKGHVVADLARAGIVPLGLDGKFAITASTEEKERWPIWKVLGPGATPEDAVVRWRVDLGPGSTGVESWTDPEMLAGWRDYFLTTIPQQGFCMISGTEVPLAVKHPRGIRNSADGAKLISSNDKSGFTFRGRFTGDDGRQATALGYEMSQKAHNALRWLIGRQGARVYRHGDQVYVAWAVSGRDIPEFADDWENEDEIEEREPLVPRDFGQYFSRRLGKYMRGYGDIDTPTEDLVVIGLDSASPGRMAIIYYREIKGSEFLARLMAWHTALAWPQRISRRVAGPKGKSVTEVHWRPSAPSPEAIAEAAFGRRLDDKLRKSTIERLIPCIIDSRPIPRDLVESCVARALLRAGREPWEWDQALGVTCAVFKGYFATQTDFAQRRLHDMTLDPKSTRRDYLFGRLLAVAEDIEKQALYYAGENRPTNAERLMQHFAERPAMTWRTIELALDPYMQRIRGRSPGLLRLRKDLLDDILSLFEQGDFTDPTRLSGEFLLGYHCQRLDLRYKPNAESGSEGESK